MADQLNLESQRTPPQAFRDAVAAIGGQSATSRLIGISQQAISERIARGLDCPDRDGAPLKVEKASGISRHELRPDLYPRETPSTLAPRGVQHVDRPDPATRHHFGAGLEQAR